jgi:hypothetical protein
VTTLAASNRKIDVAKALELRLTKNMTYAEIGLVFDCSPQAIEQALASFKSFLTCADPASLKAYQEHKPSLLNAVEQRLLRSLIDEGKIEKASLNNVAYAYQQVANQNRLESGKSTSNVGVLAKLVIDSEERLGTSAKDAKATAVDITGNTPPQDGDDTYNDSKST